SGASMPTTERRSAERNPASPPSPGFVAQNVPTPPSFNDSKSPSFLQAPAAEPLQLLDGRGKYHAILPNDTRASSPPTPTYALRIFQNANSLTILCGHCGPTDPNRGNAQHGNTWCQRRDGEV